MNRGWPAAACEFATGLGAALEHLGGVNLARAAEADATARQAQLAPVLRAQGVLELDPFGDEDEAAAAALAAQALGTIVAPWPIAAALAAQAIDADAVYVVDGPFTHLEHVDVFASVAALGLDGSGLRVRAAGPCRAVPLDPFGVPVEIDGPIQIEPRVAQMRLVLDAFYASGAMSTVTRLATQYAADRRQFGQSIGRFGEIRWRLADLTVANDGLAELARFTWYLMRSGQAVTSDVLALRVGMLETIGSVLKNSHQIFGAIGLCEEHDIVVIDRHLSSLEVRPAGGVRTATMLLEAINRGGFSALFPVPARA